jgi:hypothetical protein
MQMKTRMASGIHFLHVDPCWTWPGYRVAASVAKPLVIFTLALIVLGACQGEGTGASASQPGQTKTPVAKWIEPDVEATDAHGADTTNPLEIPGNINFKLALMGVKPAITNAEWDTLRALERRKPRIERIVARKLLNTLKDIDPERYAQEANLKELRYASLRLGTFCETPAECREMLAKDLRDFRIYLEVYEIERFSLYMDYFHYSQSTTLRPYWHDAPWYQFTWEFWEAAYAAAPELEEMFDLDSTPFHMYSNEIFNPYETNPVLKISNSQAKRILTSLQANAPALNHFTEYHLMVAMLVEQVQGKSMVLVRFGD